MILLVSLVLLFGVAGLAYWLCMSSWSQLFGKFPYKIDTKEKIIALTFDDGPNEPYTSQIAEYLYENDIKATFFQVGQCVERFPEVSKKLVTMGHVVGNHSVHHQFRRHLIHPGFESEIDASQSTISGNIGRTPSLFRPPWLWRTPFLFRSLKKRGLVAVSGEFCHNREVLQPSPQVIAGAVIRKARPGLIVIFHDGVEGKTGDRSQTVKAVKLVVPQLIKQGYTFVTVDKMLGVKPYL